MRTLSLACCAGQPTRPLLDGRVGIGGCTILPFRLPLDEILRRAYEHAEFDLVELGLGSYVQSVAGGACPYIAIPAFPLRSFRHRNIYVRADRIAAPADLAGRRIGLIDYGMTAAVVLRALLRDQYGIDTTSLRWVVGGMEALEHRQPAHPPGIDVEPAGAPLASLLRDGTIDALIALSPPSCLTHGDPRIACLFANPRAAEAAYFAATGVFPIMHIAAIRRSLATEPDLVAAVYAAFLQAKTRAMADLGVTQAPKLTLPWLAAAYEDSIATLGADYWSYGLAGNRDILDGFLAAAHHDRLTPRRLALADLFHPATLDT